MNLLMTYKLVIHEFSNTVKLGDKELFCHPKIIP